MSEDDHDRRDPSVSGNVPKDGKKRSNVSRRNGHRRARDRELESMSKSAMTMATHAVRVVNDHLADCAQNSREMKQTLTDNSATLKRVAAYVDPMIKQAEDRAEFWKRVLKTAQTDWMVAILKYAPPMVMLALIAMLFPAAANLIQAVFKALARAMIGG